jgi:drug/metabolite transporter (DMT)-like permease
VNVAGLSAIFLGEPISSSQWIATPVALRGLALAAGLLDDMASARSASCESILGLLLCMGGFLSYAAATLLTKSK